MSEVKVDIKLLKELRDTTGVSLADCRSALVESHNDFQKALEVLKVKGLSKALSKSSNAVTEGMSNILVSGNHAIIGELNCQTDFVTKNLEFTNLFNKILVTILEHNSKSVDEALKIQISKKETLNDFILSAISKIGENIVLKRFQIIEKQPDETFGYYVHTGGSKSGLVTLTGKKNDELAKDIAMQLVAMSPKFIDVDQIDQKVKDNELEIAKEQVKNDPKSVGKPKEILEKMTLGKFNKSLGELTIVNQAFIKDPAITIKQYLDKNNATIKSMVRYEVGELI